MSYTLAEIRKQPKDWATTLDILTEKAETWKALFREKNYENVYFTGCGTSYYISIYTAYMFQEITGIPSRAIPASEVLLMPDRLFDKSKRNLVIGVGRSGTTTESVEAIRKFREQGYGDALSIACRASAPASHAATYAIELDHVYEQSVVMTGTFTNVILASQILAAFASDNEVYLNQLRRIPEVGEDVLRASEDAAKPYGGNLDIRQFLYLGLGGYYGLASEAVLKLKEMTQTPTEAYNPLEFRHGPISIVDNDTLVVLFQSDKASQHEADVLEDVRRLGGQTLLLCDNAPVNGEKAFVLDVHLPDAVRAILYMPFVQFIGYHRAIALGINPDQPRNLTQVVTLSL